MAKLEIPNHIDRGELATFGAGLLAAVVIKRVIVNFDEWVFNIFSSVPEWAVIVGMIIAIYLLFKYEG